MEDARIPCRGCAPLGVVDAAALEAHLQGYIDTLSPDLRVDPGEYEERLRLCRACPHQRHFTCGFCGCYIQARAAKHALACPDPASPRWGRGTPMRRLED